MTLRARLALFFVGIVVLPLVGATLAFQLLSARQAEARADSRLQDGERVVGALWQERLGLVEQSVSDVAQEVAPFIEEDGFAGLVEDARVEHDLDFLTVSEADGTVVTAAVGIPDFRPDVEPPSAEALASEERQAPGLLRVRVPVTAGDRTLTFGGGQYAGQALAVWLSSTSGLEVGFVSGQSVLASTTTFPGGIRGGEVDEGRRARFVPVGPPGNGILLITETEATNLGALWLVAAGGLVAATLLGLALASMIARPLQRLAEGARRVASGDLHARVEAGPPADVARVAESFNTMTEYLRTYVGELESSRDELRHNLDRMGGALGRTLDLEGMLEVILDTAAVTLGATTGALFLRRPSGQDLQLEVAQGYLPPEGSVLAVGSGVAGKAAEGAEGAQVLVPGDDVLPFGPIEPPAETAVAVPLMRGDRVMGVIALYGRPTLEPFASEDVHTLASFASQASVAIENVLLHQETQQLSITDGLTGLWNRRYLELSLRKEIERASRFNRPLSVLMVDIDRFKRVNDRYGHQRGDEVLIEVTRRLVAEIRGNIDFVARYGGEEFVVVLPETPCDGGKVVAEKLRSAVRDEAFDGHGSELRVTVSVGVSAFPLDGVSAEDILRAADEAMYRAKRAGRDRVETASAA